MPLPNFLIIGTTKGGTTSLYKYLRVHPEVYMSPVKEPRYFAFDNTNSDHVSRVPNTYPITSIKQYQKLFDGVNEEKAIGEASPMYLNSPIAAARIKSCLPEVKLIASLRNPVDRAYSHYLMYYREGRVKAPFIDAYRNVEGVDRYCQHYIGTSNYFEKLKRYFDLFEQLQIKVIFLEDLKNDTTGIVRDIFQYIDVDTNFEPVLSKIHNQGGYPKNGAGYSLARYGFLSPKIYSRISPLLKPMVPQFIVDFRKNLMQKNLGKPPQLTADVREEVIDFYREDILKTQDLIQKDLSSWLQKD